MNTITVKYQDLFENQLFVYVIFEYARENSNTIPVLEDVEIYHTYPSTY